jgi:hypothetical protein
MLEVEEGEEGFTRWYVENRWGLLQYQTAASGG